MFIFVFKLTNLFLSFLLLLDSFCYVSFLISIAKCILVLVTVILFNTIFKAVNLAVIIDLAALCKFYLCNKHVVHIF